MRRTGKVHERKQIWQSVVTTLAAVVVFVTTYALIIPAITWEKTLICELEEHVHTDFCYNSKGELVCGKEEHKHIDACFDAPKATEPAYICGKSEHTHTDDCYFEDGTLKCTITEHIHDKMCLPLTVRPKMLLAAPPSPPTGGMEHKEDPDTSAIQNWFTPYSDDNDGRVAADKSVTYDDDYRFKIVLSALGQSYKEQTAEEDRIHPDVVFILDMSRSMFSNTVSDGHGGQMTRAKAVVQAVNHLIAELLEKDPETRIGIVAYGHKVYDDMLYLPLAKYRPLSGGEYLTYDDAYNGATNGTRMARIPLTSIKNGSATGSIDMNYYTPGFRYSITKSGTGSRTTYSITITGSAGSNTMTVGNGTAASPARSNSIKTKALGGPNTNNHNLIVVNNGQNLEIFLRFDENNTTYSIGVNGNLTNDKTGRKVNVAPFVGYEGTYTQAGIVSAAKMLVDNAETNRIPSIILISDGEPTYAYAFDVDNPGEMMDSFVDNGMENLDSNTYGDVGSHGKFGNGSTTEMTQGGTTYVPGDHNSRGALMGYYTIRTAMYAKELIYNAYYDAFLTNHTPQDAMEMADAMFFSVGPGVTTLYGKTVLSPGTASTSDPTKTNFEACENDTVKNTSSTNEITAQRLYQILSSSVPVGDMQYVNYADYSVAGDMTAGQINTGMDGIINRIKAIPRPIFEKKKTISYDMIDVESFVTMIDTLGEDMLTTGTFVLTYENTDFPAVLAETGGTFDSNSEFFAGCSYDRYAFAGNVVEASTGAALDLREVRLYLVTDTHGDQVVVWQFPSTHLPTIYHVEDTTTYHAAQPIRLTYKVQTDGEALPGVLYQTNSTDDVASILFHVSDDNPYYDTGSGLDYNAKSKNKTSTEPYSYKAVRRSGRYMKALLGNNGILMVPFDLEIKKVWDDGNPDDITSVGVNMYADGVLKEHFTLDTTNSWTKTFKDLPVFDGNGAKITYSFVEDTVPGYKPAIGEMIQDITTEEVLVSEEMDVPAGWVAFNPKDMANSTKQSKIRIRTSGGRYLYNNSGTLAKNDSFTDSDAYKWNVERKSDGSFWIRSVSDSDQYIRFDSGNNTYSFNSGGHRSLQINSNSQIYYNNNGTNMYLRVGSSSISAKNNSYEGSTMVFEKYQEATHVDAVYDTVTKVLYKVKITNSPFTEMPVEKQWDSPESASAGPITVAVYQKNGDVVEKVTGSDLVISAATDWKGKIMIRDLGLDFSSKTYYIAENASELFITDYEGGEKSYVSDGTKTFLAVKLDPNASDKIIVKNTRTYDLPATGGIGTDKIVMIGSCLVAVPLIYALYVLNQRRKRERRRAE